jgi:hypothetical protein
MINAMENMQIWNSTEFYVQKLKVYDKTKSLPGLPQETRPVRLLSCLDAK